MGLRTVIYDPGYASRAISSPLPFVPFREWKSFILWKLLPFVDGTARDQPPCCEAAAFFNESINRDIITERYLKQPSVT